MSNTNPRDNHAPAKMPVTGSHLPTEDEYHARIDAEFDAKNRRLKRKKRGKMLLTILLLGGAIGGGYTWYNANPENQDKLQSVLDEATAVKDSITEGTSVDGIMETYEEGLGEVAKHGESVDTASAALSGQGELNLERPAVRPTAETTENKPTDAVTRDTEQTNPTNEAPVRRGF